MSASVDITPGVHEKFRNYKHSSAFREKSDADLLEYFLDSFEVIGCLVELGIRSELLSNNEAHYTPTIPTVVPSHQDGPATQKVQRARKSTPSSGFKKISSSGCTKVSESSTPMDFHSNNPTPEEVGASTLRRSTRNSSKLPANSSKESSRRKSTQNTLGSSRPPPLAISPLIKTEQVDADEGVVTSTVVSATFGTIGGFTHTIPTEEDELKPSVTTASTIHPPDNPSVTTASTIHPPDNPSVTTASTINPPDNPSVSTASTDLASCKTVRLHTDLTTASRGSNYEESYNTDEIMQALTLTHSKTPNNRTLSLQKKAEQAFQFKGPEVPTREVFKESMQLILHRRNLILGISGDTVLLESLGLEPSRLQESSIEVGLRTEIHRINDKAIPLKAIRQEGLLDHSYGQTRSPAKQPTVKNAIPAFSNINRKRAPPDKREHTPPDKRDRALSLKTSRNSHVAKNRTSSNNQKPYIITINPKSNTPSTASKIASGQPVDQPVCQPVILETVILEKECILKNKQFNRSPAESSEKKNYSKQHYSSNTTGPVPDTVSCLVCCMTFSDKAGFLRHIKTVSTSSRYNPLTHRREFADVCSYCEVGFETALALARHQTYCRAFLKAKNLTISTSDSDVIINTGTCAPKPSSTSDSTQSIINTGTCAPKPSSTSDSTQSIKNTRTCAPKPSSTSDSTQSIKNTETCAPKPSSTSDFTQSIKNTGTCAPKPSSTSDSTQSIKNTRTCAPKPSSTSDSIQSIKNTRTCAPKPSSTSDSTQSIKNTRTCAPKPSSTSDSTQSIKNTGTCAPKPSSQTQSTENIIYKTIRITNSAQISHTETTAKVHDTRLSLESSVEKKKAPSELSRDSLKRKTDLFSLTCQTCNQKFCECLLIASNKKKSLSKEDTPSLAVNSKTDPLNFPFPFDLDATRAPDQTKSHRPKNLNSFTNICDNYYSNVQLKTPYRQKNAMDLHFDCERDMTSRLQIESHTPKDKIKQIVFNEPLPADSSQVDELPSPSYLTYKMQGVLTSQKNSESSADCAFKSSTAITTYLKPRPENTPETNSPSKTTYLKPQPENIPEINSSSKTIRPNLIQTNKVNNVSDIQSVECPSDGSSRSSQLLERLEQGLDKESVLKRLNSVPKSCLTEDSDSATSHTGLVIVSEEEEKPSSSSSDHEGPQRRPDLQKQLVSNTLIKTSISDIHSNSHTKSTQVQKDYSSTADEMVGIESDSETKMNFTTDDECDLMGIPDVVNGFLTKVGCRKKRRKLRASIKNGGHLKYFHRLFVDDVMESDNQIRLATSEELKVGNLHFDTDSIPYSLDAENPLLDFDSKLSSHISYHDNQSGAWLGTEYFYKLEQIDGLSVGSNLESEIDADTDAECTLSDCEGSAHPGCNGLLRLDHTSTGDPKISSVQHQNLSVAVGSHRDPYSKSYPSYLSADYTSSKSRNRYCIYCDKRFRNSSALKRHKNEYHFLD